MSAGPTPESWRGCGEPLRHPYPAAQDRSGLPQAAYPGAQVPSRRRRGREPAGPKGDVGSRLRPLRKGIRELGVPRALGVLRLPGTRRRAILLTARRRHGGRLRARRHAARGRGQSERADLREPPEGIARAGGRTPRRRPAGRGMPRAAGEAHGRRHRRTPRTGLPPPPPVRSSDGRPEGPFLSGGGGAEPGRPHSRDGPRPATGPGAG